LADGWHGNEVEPRFVADIDDDGIADLVFFDPGMAMTHGGTTDGHFSGRVTG
jgi:hypothetical protein